ncbi:cation:proton antiporter [uncultured Methanoregula sp.]|uniref:cation:proton antiporter domain-containing protein n=1 Tax=uncultured Methanoregula sp. TaxID=1005933 RepID=UPI002AAB4E0F|nr:cation:proton antiporter [uncultured Methanoregula sp.]
MDTYFLVNLLIIFVLSILVLFVCSYLRVPTMVGFLITGVVAGPFGLAFITDVDQVNTFAEIGVALLLFTIGLEFSFKNLIRVKKAVIIGGLVQVLTTIAAVYILLTFLGRSFGEAVFIGFLISLSSTAIVIKLLQQRGEIDSPYGKNTLAILIFQDLVTIPMMLLIPVLSGTGSGPANSLPVLLLQGCLFIVVVFISARWIVPRILFEAAKFRSKELFLFCILGICVAIAYLTSNAGLSLALGAFFAGLIIAESEFNLEALSDIIPFRDVFTSFFFISIGMLLNVHFFISNTIVIIIIVLGIIIIKFGTGSISALVLGLPVRTVLLIGFAMAQIGEFSFVLSQTGLQYSLISDETYQLFLSVSLITMACTPFMISAAPRIIDTLSDKKVLKRQLPEPEEAIRPDKPHELTDHIIIVGYGLNGQNVAKTARLSAIPYTIIEMNAETVKAEKEKGEPIFFGDATDEDVLKHAHIASARIILIVISDPVAIGLIVKHARLMNPGIHIIARTRYLGDVNELYKLGADEVVSEQFETSIELFTRILTRYLIPKKEIETFIEEIRKNAYVMLRDFPIPDLSYEEMKINNPEITIASVRLPEGSHFIEKTLSESAIRQDYHITILAIRRKNNVLTNPPGDEKFEEHDLVIVHGNAKDISRFIEQVQNLK